MRDFDRDEKKCGNCKHWLINEQAYVTYKAGSGSVTYKAAQCGINAVEADAGKCVVMLSEDGHCQNHEDAWEPSDDFIAGMEVFA